MFRYLAFIGIISFTLGGISFASVSLESPPSGTFTFDTLSQSTPVLDNTRPDPPPTVYPPTQSDNGAQTYWSMCLDCHGDRGQGLTDEWRSSFALQYRDCWQSGCHGTDFSDNSFEIPQTGAPAIAGTGSLARFSNAFELHTYIQENMPFFPPGSISSEQGWSLTAYVFRLNDRQLTGLTLDEVNSSAIPIHQEVILPASEVPGVLVLTGILILAAMGMRLQAKRSSAMAATSAARTTFFHHLHPPRIPALQSRFGYTLGAGGVAIFLSVILLITGLLEMYYYIPTPDQAALSVETITTLVPFGNLVRNLHFWSAQSLVIVITIHLLRVILTGAYAPPRRFNYLLGLGLLVLILLLDFTGYVLRWDEGIRWALVVGANLLKTIPIIGDSLYQFVIGGSEPGVATITRFYTWHLFGLTLGVGILIIWHVFRVRRDGGIAVPPPLQRQERQRITRHTLVRREVRMMFIVGIVLLLFSLLVPAPIAQPLSQAGVITSDTQAPWFFLWVQQLLRFGDPFLWGVMVPVLVVIMLGLFPFVLPNVKDEELGRWFPLGNRLAQVLASLILFAIFLLTVLGAVSG
jgi:quinol-cytochrome oxidoreductase complex cytochrome b subunit/mono/diheme cytochrome c family protein